VSGRCEGVASFEISTMPSRTYGEDAETVPDRAKSICFAPMNSLKTGPVTEEGNARSRQNAVRHGLTAETVIDALEDAEDL
jgi:hypothetical protein